LWAGCGDAPAGMIEIFFDHAFEYAFGSLFRSRGAGYRLDMRAIGGAIDSTRK
jgi:hypothetical protein